MGLYYFLLIIGTTAYKIANYLERSMRFNTILELEALGQCMLPPRHVLPGSVTRIATKI